MAFSIRIPALRSALRESDLVILDAAGARCDADPRKIVVRTTSSEHIGRADDHIGRCTLFFGGSLTKVPAPYRPATGAAAARTLAALYTRHSSECFAKVDGAFFVVILDWRTNLIVIARDKIGIARTYVLRDRESLLFSNSLKTLLQLARTPPDLDIDSVYAFLKIGWAPSPHSMFRDISKIPAGTLLRIQNGDTTAQVYYDVPQSVRSGANSPARTTHRMISEGLDESVCRGLALGGRWGSFLSGGVDSSGVVASMARSQKQIPTYFGGFPPVLNQYLPNPEEPKMSQLVATRFGTQHHNLSLGTDALESAPEIVAANEEPVSDGGCLVLGAVMRQARKEVDGLMTGIGGDFLFSGERRHRVPNLLHYIDPVPEWCWQGLKFIGGGRAFRKSPRISQAVFDFTRLLALRDLASSDMYAAFFEQATAAELKALLLPHVHAAVTRDPSVELAKHFHAARDLDPLGQILYVDIKTQLPDHCVREVETLGRHFGIKVYNPFLDSDLLDYAMGIPAAEKVSGLKLKVLLKGAMRRRVPDAILDRKKGGLGSPIRWWVTQPDGMVASVLSRKNIERRGMFCPDAIDRFREATAQGSRDYTRLLWSLFTLELWMQSFAS